MYSPVFKELNTENTAVAISELASNLWSMQEELARVFTELYERLEILEEKHDLT